MFNLHEPHPQPHLATPQPNQLPTTINPIPIHNPTPKPTKEETIKHRCTCAYIVEAWHCLKDCKTPIFE